MGKSPENTGPKQAGLTYEWPDLTYDWPDLDPAKYEWPDLTGW